MTLNQRLKGVRTLDPTLPILYRDAVIDDRTAGLLDFRRRFVYAGPSPAPSGARAKDLVYNAPDSVLQSQIDFTGKGFRFNRLAQVINLGSNWILPANCPHFAVGMILNLDNTGYGSTGTTDVPYSIAGLRAAASGGYQYLFSMFAARPAGTLKTLQFLSNGRSVQAPYTAGGLVHVVGEYEVIGSTHVSRLFVNKTLVATSAATTQAYVPIDPSDVPIVGRIAPSFGSSFSGDANRLWLQRLDLPGRSLSEIIALDYDANFAGFA